MKRIPYIIIGVALLLFASCGQQQQVKSVVKDFMEQHLADASDLSYLDFSDVDSTRVVSDSLLQAMRRGVSDRYQSPLPFTDRRSPKLFHIRVNYTLGQDTCSATFYLDSELSSVVALKENR